MAYEFAVHPALRWMLWHHPLIALPGLLGSGLAAALAQTASVSLLRDSPVLHGWIVSAACAIYLVADRRKEALTR